jgi:hypothetical protein
MPLRASANQCHWPLTNNLPAWSASDVIGFYHNFGGSVCQTLNGFGAIIDRLVFGPSKQA